MNTRPSLVTLHDPALIVPIHGLDGPCLTLELDRLADALTLHRQLQGSLLLFDDDEAIRYQFGSNPPQFIDPLIQESQPDGYDLTATLLNLEARVLLGHYETQAAVDAAYEALLDYAAWDPTASPDQTAPPSTPSPSSQGEEAGYTPIGALHYVPAIRLQILEQNIGNPRAQLEAVDEALAALRGIFHVYPDLPGMANHQWAFDSLTALRDHLRLKTGIFPLSPEKDKAGGEEAPFVTANPYHHSSGFQRELEQLLNCHSAESGSNSPDFILATYLIQCLYAFNVAVTQRDKWYGVHLQPGHSFFYDRPAPVTDAASGDVDDSPTS